MEIEESRALLSMLLESSLNDIDEYNEHIDNAIAKYPHAEDKLIKLKDGKGIDNLSVYKLEILVGARPLTLLSPLAKWKEFFITINEECSKNGESVVLFSDVDYYANQVHNLTNEVDYIASYSIAMFLNDPS